MKSLFRVSMFVMFVLSLALVPATLFALQGAPAPAPEVIPLPAKVLGLATAVFTLLQALKRYIFPGLSGKGAVVFNLALSVLGVIVGLQPEQLFTAGTLVAVITVLASGVHGLWQTFFGTGSTTQSS